MMRLRVGSEQTFCPQASILKTNGGAMRDVALAAVACGCIAEKFVEIATFPYAAVSVVQITFQTGLRNKYIAIDCTGSDKADSSNESNCV